MPSDIRPNLIYDIGMHRGEDTEFYLKKGFDVVAVEANESLCAESRRQFSAEIDSGRLRLIDRAISRHEGLVDFFVNPSHSEWGTTAADWADRNARRGAPHHVVQVPSTTLERLLSEYGVPYYMKIDVEGSDLDCLMALRGLTVKPRYLSVEASATSMAVTNAQLAVLEDLGYRKFKIVAQHRVTMQRCPYPAREGAFVDHHFQLGSSGLFGEEAPGHWVSLRRLKLHYLRYYALARLVGVHTGILRNVTNRHVKSFLRRAFPDGFGWYDTHATF